MDVKYPICCGVDVHKSFLVTVIVRLLNPNHNISKRDFLLLIMNCYNLKNC